MLLLMWKNAFNLFYDKIIKNLEIIIIDDCGMDNSMELVEEL